MSFYRIPSLFNKSNFLAKRHHQLLFNQRNTLTQSRNILQRTSTDKVKFTTSPYNDAVNRFKSQAKLAGKITGYTLLSVSAAVGFIWQLSHWYIEYALESTPAELGYKGRNLLHGAHVREKIVPDYEIASLYVQEALRIALEEQNLQENSDTVIDLRLRLAEDEAKAGNLLDAITEYTRSWKLLMDKEERTIDPRIIDAAKHIGDLYMRIGDYEHAEEYLAWALHTSERADKDSLLHTKIKLSLASLYAVQRDFKLAQPLLSQILKSLPEQEVCLRAIVQNQLSEIMYGLNKTEECMGWAQAALDSCSKGLNNQDCLECGAVVSNNMGRILELRGELEQAMAYYKQAVNYSTNINDSRSHEKYILNSERVQDTIATKELKQESE